MHSEVIHCTKFPLLCLRFYKRALCLGETLARPLVLLLLAFYGTIEVRCPVYEDRGQCSLLYHSFFVNCDLGQCIFVFGLGAG